MPNIKRIAADAEPVPEDNRADLEAALSEADAEVEEFQKLRYEIRQTTPKPELLSKLGESEEAFNEALRKQADLQKRLARLDAPDSGPGQTVPVGAATEGEGS